MTRQLISNVLGVRRDGVTADLHDCKARSTMTMIINSHYARPPVPATPSPARAKARVKHAAKKANAKVAKSKPRKKK